MERTARGVIGATVLVAALVASIVMWRYAGTLPADFEYEFKEVRPAPGSAAEHGVMSLAYQLVLVAIFGLWTLFGALPIGADGERLGVDERRALRKRAFLPGAAVAVTMPLAVVMSGMPVRVQLLPLAVAAIGAVIIGQCLSTGTSSRAAFRGAGLAVVSMVLATPFVALGALVLGLGSMFSLLLFPILMGIVGGLLPTQGARLYLAGSRVIARHPRLALVGEWVITLLGAAIAVNVLLQALDFTPYQEMIGAYNEVLEKQGWDPEPIPRRP